MALGKGLSEVIHGESIVLAMLGGKTESKERDMARS